MPHIEPVPPSATLMSRSQWIFLIFLVTVAGACLRWPALQGDLWMDEIWSFRLAHSEPSAVSLVTKQAWANNHLLNTLWLRGWDDSVSEVWYRLPSFLCGLLGIPLAAWVLARWGAGREGALLGAVLVALSFFQIQYSSEARGYAGAFACALIAFGLRYPESAVAATRLRAGAFGAVQAIGMLWHPGYVIVVVGLIVAQMTSLVAASRDARAGKFWELLRWQAFPVLVLAGYQMVFLSKLRYGAAGYQEPVRPILEAAGWTLNLLWLGWGGPLAVLLLAAGFGLGMKLIFPRQRELAIALVLSCVLLPVGLFFLHPPRVTVDPNLLVLFPRYFHLPFGVALLVVAWGASGLKLGRMLAMFGLPLLLCIGLAILLPPFYEYGRIGSRLVLEHLAAKTDGTVRIATNELTRGAMQFGFYARRLGLQDRFVWIEREYWLINPPDYMISLAPGNVPAAIVPPSILSKDRTISYELDRVFPYGGASGFNCLVFRRKWSGANGSP